VNNKPTKIDEIRWSYRGFEISRNWASENGTGRTCKSQRGYRIAPGGGFNGTDWEPTIKEAAERVDLLYDRFFELSTHGKWIVIQAVRKLQKERRRSRAS
jgi:hypothetical protein